MPAQIQDLIGPTAKDNQQPFDDWTQDVKITGFYFLRTLRDSENKTYALQASMQSTTEKENVPQLQYLCKEVIHQNSLDLKSLPPLLKNDLITKYNQNQIKINYKMIISFYKVGTFYTCSSELCSVGLFFKCEKLYVIYTNEKLPEFASINITKKCLPYSTIDIPSLCIPIENFMKIYTEYNVHSINLNISRENVKYSLPSYVKILLLDKNGIECKTPLRIIISILGTNI